MSEAAAEVEATQNNEQQEQVKNETEEMKDDENEQPVEGMDGEDEEEEEEEDEESNFINNHDLIGVKGIIAAQKNEIEKKKVGLVLSLAHSCN